MFGVLYEWRLRLQREAAIKCAKHPLREIMDVKERHTSARKKNEAVKGVSRRVVIVRKPDSRIFEEAIFIVSEEFLNGGVGADELLREAEQAADGYIETTLCHPPHRVIPWLRTAAYVAVGAAATVLVWLALYYLI